MKSGYLASLNATIAATSSGLELDCLRAERAAYHARLGETERAREEIKAVQAENGKNANARLSVLTNIAEGLCHYYEDMGEESHDRLRRAYALAIATKQHDLASRSAIWLSLIAYGRYDFDAMTAYLDASHSPNGGDRSTRSRALLTVAQTIHLANRFDIAKPWYRRARQFAAETGDGATVSAIMHNMSSIWAANRRNSWLGGLETADKMQIALLGAVSTMNFDDLNGASSLPIFTPLLQAQLYSLDGRFRDAFELYDLHLAKLKINSVPGWQKWLLADRAWCLLQLGDSSQAKCEFDAVFDLVSDRDHVDDRAAMFSRLSEGYRVLGVEERSQQCGMVARECWAAFRHLQEQMLQKTERFAWWLAEV